MEINNTLPYSKETEELILGCLINQWEEQEVYHAYTQLDRDCFYFPFHQLVFDTIQTLVEEKKAPDMLTIIRHIQSQNEKPCHSEIAQIISQAPYTHYPYQHARVLQEISQRRKLGQMAMELYKEINDETIEPETLIKKATDKINRIAAGPSTEVNTLNEAIQGVRDRIARNHDHQDTLTGTPTGFSQIDKETGGLQASDLIIIAADTSQGKTSLALKFALEAARTEAGVAIYSLEMKKELLTARMIAAESHIQVSRLLYKPLSLQQIEKVEQGLAKLYNLPIYFDDRTTSNIDTILASIRSLKVRHDIKGAIVDYLQILSVPNKGSTKEAQMGEAARRLKNLAHELDIWIIGISQLNRDNINPVPTLGRLRDSGQIGEAADIVMLIYRAEVYGRTYPAPFQTAETKDTAMIDIAKGRNTGLSKFICSFTPTITRFTELTQIPQLPPDETEDPF